MWRAAPADCLARQEARKAKEKQIFFLPSFLLSIFFLFSTIPLSTLTAPMHILTLYYAHSSFSYVHPNLLISLSVSQTITCEFDENLRGLHVISEDQYLFYFTISLCHGNKWNMFQTHIKKSFIECDHRSPSLLFTLPTPSHNFCSLFHDSWISLHQKQVQFSFFS